MQATASRLGVAEWPTGTRDRGRGCPTQSAAEKPRLLPAASTTHLDRVTGFGHGATLPTKRIDVAWHHRNEVGPVQNRPEDRLRASRRRPAIARFWACSSRARRSIGSDRHVSVPWSSGAFRNRCAEPTYREDAPRFAVRFRDGAPAGLCAGVHARAEPGLAGRRVDRGGLPAGVDRSCVGGAGPAGAAGCGAGAVAAGRHAGGVAAGPAGPVVAAPDRGGDRAGRAGGGVPVAAGEHRHHDRRGEAGVPSVRGAGPVRAGDHPGPDGGRADRGSGPRPGRGPAVQAHRRAGPAGPQDVRRAGVDGRADRRGAGGEPHLDLPGAGQDHEASAFSLSRWRRRRTRRRRGRRAALWSCRLSFRPRSVGRR